MINSESYKLDTIANVVLGSEILITRMGYYVTSDQSHKAVCTYISLSGYFKLIRQIIIAVKSCFYFSVVDDKMSNQLGRAVRINIISSASTRPAHHTTNTTGDQRKHESLYTTEQSKAVFASSLVDRNTPILHQVPVFHLGTECCDP